MVKIKIKIYEVRKLMEKRYTYKPYSLRLKEYEYEKQKLIDQCLSCEDYEKAVQELAESLDI